MGDLLSRLNTGLTTTTHKIVVKQIPGTQAVAGFVASKQHALEYYVTNRNANSCTVAELLVSMNMYRTSPIQALSAAAGGPFLAPHEPLALGATVWV